MLRCWNEKYILHLHSSCTFEMIFKRSKTLSKLQLHPRNQYCFWRRANVNERYLDISRLWHAIDGNKDKYIISSISSMHAETQEHVCQYNITVSGRCRAAVLCVGIGAANRLIGEVVQSRRRPLLGPSPGWKHLLPLSHLRHYAKRVLTPR